jgi:hypothetical protein
VVIGCDDTCGRQFLQIIRQERTPMPEPAKFALGRHTLSVLPDFKPVGRPAQANKNLEQKFFSQHSSSDMARFYRAILPHPSYMPLPSAGTKIVFSMDVEKDNSTLAILTLDPEPTTVVALSIHSEMTVHVFEC